MDIALKFFGLWVAVALFFLSLGLASILDEVLDAGRWYQYRWRELKRMVAVSFLLLSPPVTFLFFILWAIFK